MSRNRHGHGRLSAPDCPAYDIAYGADYYAGQDATGAAQAACVDAPRYPVLPAAWERYIRAEELEDDQALRLAIARVLVAPAHKNGRSVWMHQAAGTTAA